MENVSYLVMPRIVEGSNIGEDFRRLISWLSGVSKVVVTPIEEGKYEISYTDHPHKAIVSLINGQEAKIRVEVGRTDWLTMSNIRTFLTGDTHRVLSMELGCFLPGSSDYRDVTTTTLYPEVMELLSYNELQPVFLCDVSRHNQALYARKYESGAIHLVNPYLLEYFTNWKTREHLDEFSFEVAPSVERFVAFADRGMIPTSFYEFYGKSLKVINLSGINIDNPDRKVFFKPLIFEIGDENFKLFMTQSERGAQIMMSRVMPGQKFEAVLNDTLSEWGVADGFIRALVHGNIEFDKDKQGIITPRVIVNVYVDKILKKIEGTDRTWDSIRPEKIKVD